MLKRKYTILIISQKAARVKKFILSPLTLKIAAAALGIFLVVSAFMIYNYLNFKKKVVELQSLRAETRSQQAEIRSFMEKITFLEQELDKLKEMERQVEKDLKEINELKKPKKVPQKPTKKKTSLVKKEENEIKPSPSFREGEVSILERERTRLVSALHQDLLELRREFSQREQILKELHSFLQAQKSILIATPSLWPVIGRITSGFGDTRLSPSSGGNRPHRGVDISAPVGTPVVAPTDGIVSFAGRESEYGRLICLDHGHGYSTMFGHLKELLVQPGQRIRKGQIIGTVGLSGNSTGPHLHYEVRLNGNPVNPAHYLKSPS